MINIDNIREAVPLSTALPKQAAEGDGRTQFDTPDGSNKWRVGQQTVVHGDCLQFLRSLPDASVDVVVTSPPYNIGVAYRSYDDRRPRETYLAWLSEVGVEIARVFNDRGLFFPNGRRAKLQPLNST